MSGQKSPITNNAFLCKAKLKVNNITVDEFQKLKGSLVDDTMKEMEMTMCNQNTSCNGNLFRSSLSCNDITSDYGLEVDQTDLGLMQRSSSVSLLGSVEEKQMEPSQIHKRKNHSNVSPLSQISHNSNMRCLEHYKTQGTQTRESEFYKMNGKRRNTETTNYGEINNFCTWSTGKHIYHLNTLSNLKRDNNHLNNLKEKEILKPLINNQNRSLKFDGVEQKCISPCKSSIKTRNKCFRNRLSSSLTYQKQISTDSFKANRDKSFLILIGIVLIFLVCNIPRLFVKVFIISSGGEGREHFENCLKYNRLPVPGWIMIMGKSIIQLYELYNIGT